LKAGFFASGKLSASIIVPDLKSILLNSSNVIIIKILLACKANPQGKSPERK